MPRQAPLRAAPRLYIAPKPALLFIVANRQESQLCPAAKIKFLVHVMQVHFHGAFRQIQLSSNGLVAQTLRDEESDFRFTCRKLLGPAQQSRHKDMLEDIRVAPLFTSPYRIHTFDKVLAADAVQQQAVSVKQLYLLDVEPAARLQNDDAARGAVGGLDLLTKTGRLPVGNVDTNDDNVRPVGSTWRGTSMARWQSATMLCPASRRTHSRPAR